MSKRHMFITQRSAPLQNWLAAFPDAEVIPYPRPGDSLVSAPGEAVIWVHLNSGVNIPAILRYLATAAPRCPVMVVSNEPDEGEGIVALEAGAFGYASSLALPETMRQISEVLVNGGLWVGPDLMNKLMKSLAAFPHSKGTSDGLSKLSGREKEVAIAVARGESNKEIARNLDISERTVKAHLSAAFQHLGVRDRLQLSILMNGMPKRPEPESII